MTRILRDGHATFIEFASNPNVKFKEKTVTPPGFDGGGANNVTTMHNERMRTKAPKQLLDLTDGAMTVAYDPAVYPEILAMAQVNQLITITFPDGDTVEFWGWLDRFQPNEHTEGEQPTAEIVIISSNEDDNEDEFVPDHTAAS